MELKSFFAEHPAGAVAFSGGTDSALLVWAAAQYGRDWRAYYVRSPFQPAFELADARQVAHQCGVPLEVVELNMLDNPKIAANPPERCYHCKREMLSAVICRAADDGYSLVIDGTNASDSGEDRPGMRALRELNVRSPLRECGMTKGQVRALCREAGLPVWDKPAYACLATRVPTGTPITADALDRVERGEIMLADMGFRDFRARCLGNAVVLQFTQAQLPMAWERREELRTRLSPLFGQVTIDLAPRTASQ